MIPRLKFAHLPTALEPMQRLSAALKGPRLWIKRDDQTGVALGGNKARKLEFVLAEALANGAKTIITVGAAQSNHCRQTAALANRFGLECILVLSGKQPDVLSGNYLMDRLMGAEIVWTSREERSDTTQRVFQQAWEAGRRPFLIPLGASTPVGAVGYVEAFREFLSQQLNADWLIVASSSAGTQAGLALGAKLCGWQGKVLGISIDGLAGEMKQKIAVLANECAELLGEKVRLTPDEILINDEFLGGGYAVMGEPECEAVQLFAQNEGIFLDPVYTGRAAAGMLALIRRGYFREDETVVFWHTGGATAIFAAEYADIWKKALG